MAELTQTFTVLQNKVRERLSISPSRTRLTATYASSGAVTVSVATGSVVAAGSVVENLSTGEQILVSSVTSNDLTVLAEGRGYRGTTAAAGSSNDLIVVDPKHSTEAIKAAINVVYNDWMSWYFPRLLWDTTTAGNFSATANIFAAPAAALSLERVVYQPDATRTAITDLTEYAGRLQVFPTGLISTGKGFTLSRQGPTDKALWQLNKTRWTFLESGSDTVPSDFPGDGVDLIVDGAALYLLGWKQLPRHTPTEAQFHADSPDSAAPQAALFRQAREWEQRARAVAAQYNQLALGNWPSREIA